MTNAEARFNKSLRPRKPEGSLGRTAQDVHLDFHTAPELCGTVHFMGYLWTAQLLPNSSCKLFSSLSTLTRRCATVSIPSLLPPSFQSTAWRKRGPSPRLPSQAQGCDYLSKPRFTPRYPISGDYARVASPEF